MWFNCQCLRHNRVILHFYRFLTQTGLFWKHSWKNQTKMLPCSKMTPAHKYKVIYKMRLEELLSHWKTNQAQKIPSRTMRASIVTRKTQATTKNSYRTLLQCVQIRYWSASTVANPITSSITSRIMFTCTESWLHTVAASVARGSRKWPIETVTKGRCAQNEDHSIHKLQYSEKSKL